MEWCECIVAHRIFGLINTKDGVMVKSYFAEYIHEEFGMSQSMKTKFGFINISGASAMTSLT